MIRIPASLAAYETIAKRSMKDARHVRQNRFK
jgi:hypothetical protein